MFVNKVDIYGQVINIISRNESLAFSFKTLKVL